MGQVSSKLDAIAYFFAPLLLEGLAGTLRWPVLPPALSSSKVEEHSDHPDGGSGPK